MSQNFIQIPNDIFSLNLTSLQFRTLCNFIRISGFNKGHSFFGYEKLAAMNNCKKNAMIKTVKELCEMGFIQKIERANYSKSNDILLTIEKGLSRCKNGGFCNEQGEGYLKDTPNPKKGYLKDTEGYLKDTEGYLKDTEGYLKDTPNNRLTDLNNLNLNNKKNEGYLKDTPTRAAKDFEEEKAAGDAAPARSMPTPENPAESSAKRDIVADFAAKHQISGLLFNDFREALSVFFSTFKQDLCFADWLIKNDSLICYFPTEFLERKASKNKEDWSNWWSAAGVDLLYKNHFDFVPNYDEKIDINEFLKKEA